MIVDIQRFLAAESPHWDELSAMLDRIDRDPAAPLPLEEARRFHYLYQRASTGLARLAGFPPDHPARRRLEPLVARAYAEAHSARAVRRRFRPLAWFFAEFPRTFRRRAAAFWVSLGVTLAGVLFGGLALYADQESKRVLMPFSHLMQDPAQRVQEEETAEEHRLDGGHGSFAAYLMTHNIRVSVTAMAFGILFGLGSVVLLFYNGVMLGAVAADYILAGQTAFLAGWLLPHGSVEIPAILLAGQAGLVLGGALLGGGSPDPVRARLRAAGPDIVTLVGGVAVMLVWAGIVESFFSQYHEPVVPYWLKITFGAGELLLLTVFLAAAGRAGEGRA